MSNSPRQRRRAILAAMPPAQAAELLTRAVTELAEDIVTWYEARGRQWEPDNPAEAAEAQLLAGVVDLFNVWIKNLPDPPNPEDMN